jgi:L-fuculose-phosphate aldolase
METHYESQKRDMMQKCLLMEKIGYFVGTWGNISVRVPGGMIVTPSKVQYNTMGVGDFVTVSNEGTVLSGHRIPSSEAELHRALYNKKVDVGAVIHSHSPYATAVSCLHKPIPPIVEDLVQIIGGEVKCTKYVPAGQHKKIAEEAANTIGNGYAVLLANHGAICCGRDLDEAYLACQIVEKAAFIMLIAGPIGKVMEIPDEYVRSERHRFLYKYGTKEDSP